MSMVDTSSYPKPTPGPSALDTMQKFQGLEQQSLAIDQSKLELVNKRYAVVSRELQGLMGDPDLDFNKVAGRFQNLVNLGLIPSKMMAQSLQDVPTDKSKIPAWLQMKVQQGQSIVDAVNYAYGAPGTQDTGQTLNPVRVSPKPGFGIRSAEGLPVQIQAPPTTPTLNPNTNQPQLLGAQEPQLAPGTASAPPPMGAPMPAARPQPLPVGPINSPAVPGPSANFGGTVTGGEVGPNLSPTDRVAQGFPVPRGPATGPAPLFATGQAQYVEDQNLATKKLTAIKPALSALPLIKGLTTGIGTEPYNKALAGLSNLGLVPQGVTDKAAIYQEVTKKLANYVSSNPVGQRSDAAQTLAEAASPTPKQQINPALIKLTKDAIILDRVEAARANAFEGQDFTKYGEHRSAFPAKIDERAFGLDLMEEDDRKKLLTDMNKKLNSKSAKERSEAQKFRRSLSIVDKLGYFETQ